MSDGWRKFWSILLGVVFTLALVVFLLGLVVRKDLLNPALYTDAIGETGTYDRLYTELLADPQVQERFKDLTGIDINLITEELYAQIVGVAYVVLPPTQLEAGTTRFITGLTSYLKGETEELPEDLAWGQELTPEVLADRAVRASITVINGAIDKAAPLVVEKTLPFVEEEVMAYVDQIGNGVLGPIPGRLLSMTVAGLAANQSSLLIDKMLGPAAETASPETRLQMEASLAADDLNGAIAIAVNHRLQLVVAERLAARETQLAESQALLGISGAAAAVGQTRDQLVANLNMARNLIAQLRTIMIIAAIIMLISLVLIIWLNHDDMAEVFRVVGWTLFLSSGLVMILWYVVGLFLRSRLGAALAVSAVGPASLDGIVDDLVAALTRGVWDSVWTTVLPWLIIGLASLLFGYSKPVIDFINRLLAPLANYKWTALAVFFGLVVVLPLIWRSATADSRAAELPCNGHAELCDRRLNEVVFASSHNAMSIADYGWIWPMHDGTITDQLDGGVRALLVDTHYLKEETEADGDPGFLATFPPGAQEFAENLIANFRPPASDKIVLCHEFCALGYSYFSDMLGEIGSFLEANPREVLFLVIQDGTSAADTTAEIEAAGLLPYIYTHPEGQPWLTLRELIDSDQRLIVMAESEGPPPAWYGNAYDVTQETPYTFIFPSQFSCAPNRGAPDNPFFMVNHWIQRGAPNRVDGAVVNAYDFLLARAQQCQAERGLVPNFLAVNWWSQGDLMRVVDTLNGFVPPVEPGS